MNIFLNIFFQDLSLYEPTESVTVIVAELTTCTNLYRIVVVGLKQSSLCRYLCGIMFPQIV